MKRNLILGERIMHVDDKTPLNCVLAVTITGVIDSIALLSALSKIQRKHPLLRMSFNENNGQPCFVEDENIEEIPVRIVTRTDETQWLTESKKEWYVLFNITHLPLARLVWIKGESESDLLLILPHSICDGTTIINLMRELLLLLDNPEEQLISYPTFGKIQDFFPDEKKITSKNPVKHKLFSLLARGYFLLKSSSAIFNEQDNYVLNWKLDEEISENFRLRCKAEKTSVHAALCAAFLLAFQIVKGIQSNGKAICPVDIRHYLPAIKSDMMFAFAPIVELNLDKKETDLWAAARKIKNELTEKMEALKIYDLLTTSEYFHSSVNKMVKFLRTTKGSHDMTFSNIGRVNIPSTYRNFTVNTVHSPTVAFPWRNATTLVASYYHKQLDFSFLSRTSFLPEHEAEQIKEAAIEIISANIYELSDV